MNVPRMLTLLMAVAGPLSAEPPAPEPEGAEPVLDGFWPTERMIEATVRRTVLEAGARYDLTDEQQGRVEAQMLERWQTFLRDNRRELQPLVNEYFEARLGVEPPTAEQMQAWAKRAMPVADKVREHIETGSEEIRQLLNPLQRVKFDSESLGMKAGLDALQDRLQSWERGEFAAKELWQPPPGYRAPTSGDPARKGRRPAPPPDQVEIELDRWDVYVTNFIATHRLDESQQRAATSILREVKERARAHRDRHRLDIAELESAVAAGRQDDKHQVQAELKRLYGPIDDLFTELQQRLGRIPTADQRRTATQPAD
jgi:hypothetical protein